MATNAQTTRTIEDVYRSLEDIEEQVRRVRVVLAAIKSQQEGPPHDRQ